MKNADLEELQREILAARNRTAAGRGHVPPAVRDRAIKHVAERRAAGETLEALAQSLGLNLQTLKGWLQRQRESIVASHAASLRAVRVVAETTAPGARRVTVWGPRGLRIDDLSLDDVAELVRRLA